MSSVIRDVPVFSGQGTDAVNSARTREQGIHDATTSSGAVLITACFDVFREELTKLSSLELLHSEILLDEFHTGQDLLAATSSRHIRNPIISGTRLFLLQILRYLAHIECSGSIATRFADALQLGKSASLGILGFSSGVLAASVVASSQSTLSYISNSTEAFRLAFWVGLRMQEYRQNFLRSADPAADELPWSVVLLGIDQTTVEAAIAEFESQNASGSSPTITATTSAQFLTVSGDPIQLRAFCATLPSTCAVHKTTLSTLYHSARHLAATREQVLRDVAARAIRFPNFSDLIAPIRSTHTGELLNSTTAGSLVEAVVDMLLVQPVNWALAISSLVRDAGDGASVRLLNYGPGTGLMRTTEKALAGTDFHIVDLTGGAESPSDEPKAKHEPIAIVGMAINMPGAPDKAKLWELLEQGINTCTEVPESRFNVSDYTNPSNSKLNRSMKAHTGNFLVSASSFDAKFFKISPREARSMDPQQRVLLQASYEALENAGYVPDATPSFQKESIGCYVGVATRDYAQNLRDDIDVYYSTGTLAAFLSGRISYVMQLGGPSVTVDTACSSSAVAIYQACRALGAGDCKSAVAGGVNVITSPDMMLGLDRGHFLSPTGQCKAFDASADGYSRSEGCGMFVLKRLSDAVAENDTILGVIRGIEVNQSGLAHSITHPHAPTQTKLFKQVMENAGVDPARVSVVEAHGTGTQAGDPSELESIRSVFAVNRSARNPLHITSVKANIGHLEAASGAAGLAKLLLMLRHQTIPRQILLNNLNPKIAPLDLDHTIISTSQIAWPGPPDGHNRMALLNNFGAAGSNTALLLEEYRAKSSPTSDAQEHLLFGLSAKTESALDTLRSRYMAWLQDPASANAALSDIAYTATARRQIYPYRLGVTANGKRQLAEKLKTATPVHVTGAVDGVVFVFSGQGSQYLGMGASLYRTCPVFRQHIDECNRFLVGAGFPSILRIITAEPGAEDIGLTREETFEAYQTSIFAVEYALAKLWMSWGITPVAVVGHSLGEYAALVVANVLTLRDALTLVANRVRLMVQKCASETTGMLAVKSSAAAVSSMDAFGKLSVACYNSSSQCVVSGAISELKEFKSYLGTKGYKCILLDVPFGFHSSAMQPLLEDLTTIAAGVSFSAPTIPIVSNVHGNVVMPGDSSVFDARYIARHCGEPVLFEDAVSALLDVPQVANTAAWIELGPDTTVLPMLKSHSTFPQEVLLLGSLRKKEDAWSTLAGSLEKLYLSNVDVRWREVYAHASSVACVNLPSYPFATTEYWVDFKEEVSPSSPALAASPSYPAPKYTMLQSWSQYPSESNGRVAVFETPIAELVGFIKAHAVGGFPLCPASVYLEQVYAGTDLAIQHLSMTRSSELVALRDVEFSKPLVYVENVARVVKTSVTLTTGGSGSFVVSSQISGTGVDIVHVQGSIIFEPVAKVEQKFSRSLPVVDRQMAAVMRPVDGLQPETFSTRTAYELIFPRVVEYGKMYHTMQSLTVDPTGMEGSATIRIPSRDKEPSQQFYLHPVFSDTMFHVAGFVANMQGGVNDAYICTAVRSMRIFPELIDETAPYGIYCCNSWLADEGIMMADTYAVQLTGSRKIVAHLKGLQFRRVRLDSFKRSLSAAAGLKRPRLSDTSSRGSHTTLVEQSLPSLSPLSRNIDDNSGLLTQVKQVIAETCGIDVMALDVNTDLGSLGVDSLLSIEIFGKLQGLFSGISLDAQTLAICNTIAEIAEEMRTKGAPDQSVKSSSTASTLISLPAVSMTPALTSHPVKELFGSVLGLHLDEIDEDADLDSLGLDSLTTIEALHALKHQIGTDVSPDFFHTYTTIRAVQTFISKVPSIAPTAPEMLKSAIAKVQPESAFRLSSVPVPIQTSSSTASPLFLIHDGSGMVNYYDRMPPLGRNVWGIHNPHLTDDAPWPWVNLESMATEYAGYITSVTSGPILVGGWSFGGVVAFEIARQLLKKGTDVRVILIDSPSPVNHVPLSDTLLDNITNPNSQSARSTLGQLIKTQFRLNSKSLGLYNPLPSEGPFPKITLLRSREGFAPPGVSDVPSWLRERGDARNAVAGWESLTGSSVSVRDIPGHHFEPFSPSNIAEVSRQIVEACQYLEG